MDETVIALAQTIPTWRVCERFYPGVQVTSTQDGPGGQEVVTWPPGYDAPSVETLFAHKLQMAREQLGSQYQRARAEAFAARPVGDQLDAIIKGLKQVAESGITLPADTVALIEWSAAIKKNHPKPEEG